MRKSVIAMLLVVVVLFGFYNASADKTMKELDEEFDQLLEEYKQAEKEYRQIKEIEKIFENRLRVYPENGWEAEYAFKCDTSLPDISEENYKDYVGKPYLLTGTCLKERGFGCTFKLDDGRILIVSFDIYDDGDYTSFFPSPLEEERCNLYCTFTSWYHDIMNDGDLNFVASVTEKARQHALMRLKY